MIDLSVRISSLKLKNPVMTASGTFGYGTEYAPYFNIGELGAIVTKTITLNPREGNPMPRIAETPGGMLNSIGLANVGVDRFLKEKLPELESLKTNVIVNVAGNTIEEYRNVVQAVQSHKRVDAIEINISCPNVKKGGLAFGTDPEITEEIVKTVRQETNKPVIIKLTPNVTDIVSIAKAACNGGADALSLINTVLGMGIDIQTRRPTLARVVGGLSGPAIKPIALAKVYHVSKAISLPLIGIGGIMNWQDAIEFLMAGASAVQIGTLSFVQPDGALSVLNGIYKYCKDNNINHITELVGSLETGY